MRLRSFFSQIQLCFTSVLSSIIISVWTDQDCDSFIHWSLDGVSEGGLIQQSLYFVPFDSEILNRSHIVNVTLELILLSLRHCSSVIHSADGHTVWSLCGGRFTHSEICCDECTFIRYFWEWTEKNISNRETHCKQWLGALHHTDPHRYL